MPVKKPKRAHYSDKRHPKHYLKVYWPYLPLMVTIAVSLFVVISRPYVISRSVLAYATNVSRQGLLEATNGRRLASGAGTLALNGKLSAAAQAKAEDMAARDYWSHDTPDGQEPWYFIEQSGYNYLKAGENLAYGFDTSADNVLGWMNSSSHRANLIDRQFSEVGFGIANANDYRKNGNQTIVVALYAAPSSSEVFASNTSSPAKDNFVATKGQSQNIAAAQTLANGSLPWSSLTAGVLIGAILAYLLIKHSFALKKAIVKSEKFILHHPLLDATMISILVLGFILNQTIGTIL